MLSGSALRGITIYDEPFWRKDGLSGMSVAPDLPRPGRARSIAAFKHTWHSEQLYVRTAGGESGGARSGRTPRHLAASIGRAVWSQSIVAKGAFGNRLG